MTTEQEVFEQALAGESFDPSTTAPEAVADVEQKQPAQDEQIATPEATEAPSADGAPEVTSEADTPATQPEDDDPVLLDGLRRSELHRLLSNAAEVETLKRMVDKAHGHIGDLKRQMQQQPQPAKQAQAAPELSSDLTAFEQDYPEIAQYVRAMASSRQEPAPQQAEAEQKPQQAPHVQQAIDPVAVEMAVLDRVHKGWRETLQSQDFNLWLGSQDAQVRSAFDSAQTADEMGAILTQHQQWHAARQAAARGQQRLRAAVTPTGSAQRPPAALTEQEIFEAALRS